MVRGLGHGLGVIAVARFPFGAVSSARPPRRPEGDARAFVLGVYPSALHVRWTLPAWAAPVVDRQVVASLAVDVEPVVFWDGEQPDAASLVDAWAASHFPDEAADQVGDVAPGSNGFSGRVVDSEVLAPLGCSPGEVWLTDAVNRYFVKRGNRRQAGQAAVIEEVYQPIATRLGLPEASLPVRPTPAVLVDRAVEAEAERLLGEWQEARAPLLITLGEESRRVAARLADRVDGPPERRLRADDPAYGRPGRIDLGGRTAEWMALTHPGNRDRRWREAIAAWARSQQPEAEPQSPGN